jgi:TctA family transporter
MIASMWIGNLMLVVINLPLIGIWIRLLGVPYRFLYPAILVFCAIGAYSLQTSTFHLLMLAGFGALGYVFLRLGCEAAPFLLGLVLGPQMEEFFRRAMQLSRGDPMVFLERPISLGLLILTAVLLALVVFPKVGQLRRTTFAEDPR